VELDRLGGLDGDLVVGGITMLDAEVVVVLVDIEVRQDELLLDHLPDDPSHLVAVEFDDGAFDLDLGHAERQPCAVSNTEFSVLLGRITAAVFSLSG
jgi:hypothetical protein